MFIRQKLVGLNDLTQVRVHMLEDKVHMTEIAGDWDMTMTAVLGAVIIIQSFRILGTTSSFYSFGNRTFNHRGHYINQADYGRMVQVSQYAYLSISTLCIDNFIKNDFHSLYSNMATVYSTEEV